MKRLIALALAAGTAGATLVAVTPADAAQGCGRGMHRGPHGRCIPAGYAPNPYVADRFYRGHGYWDGHRFYQHRRHDGGRWRYY